MKVTFTHTAVYQSALSAGQCRRFAQSLQHGSLNMDLSDQMPYLPTAYSRSSSFTGKQTVSNETLYPAIRCWVLAESPCVVRVNIQPNLTALSFFLGTCLGVTILLAGPLTQYYHLSGWAELLLACAALALLSLIAYLSIFLPIEQGRQWIIDQLQLSLIRPKGGIRRK